MAERSFVTAVDPNDPLKGNRRVYELSVYQSIEWADIGFLDRLESLDSLADECAGKERTSSGFGSGVRDIQYWFESDEELQAAKERFRDAGFRFYCHEQCLMDES